jgi:charged multivesicular body protein 4
VQQRFITSVKEDCEALNMKLFGKAKKAPTTAESIHKIKETMDMLDKRERYLQKKIDDQLAEAKNFSRQKNKRAALTCLKRKKLLEAQQQKLEGSRLKLEETVMTLESASINAEIVTSHQIASNALKNVHSNMSIDQVDRVADDLQEQMDIANEIGDAIAQPMGQMAGLDEDELNEELELLEQEMLDESLLSVNDSKISEIPAANVPARQPAVATSTPAPLQPMPAVPSSQPEMTDEERELKMLEESMSMAA